MSTEIGHSLWFIPPPGPALQLFESTIAELSRAHKSPIFSPHLTLVADVPLSTYSLEDVITTTHKLAQQFTPFTITLNKLEGVSGSLYQCLYANCLLTEELVQAMTLSRIAFGKSVSDHQFKPHISICYQEDLLDVEKETIITRLSSSFSGLSFKASVIQIWTNCEPISKWKQVGEISLK